MSPHAHTRSSFIARAMYTGWAMAAALVVVACGGGGTTSDATNQFAGAPAAASATGLRALPNAFSTRRAVAYSPYRTATKDSERANEVITDAQVKQDLDLLVSAGIGLIRLFDSSDKVALRTLRVIQDNQLDIKVMLGVYVATYEYLTDPLSKARALAANEDEMARGVALAKRFPELVVAVSVGNETMVDWSINPISTAVMANYIKTVRDQIAQPVTTDDNYAFFAGKGRNASDQAAMVLRQIDFASIHTYPMEDALFSDFTDNDAWPDWAWQQESVTAGPQRAHAMMDAALGKAQKDYALARSFMDKNGSAHLPIVIGETGWKAADPSDNRRYRYTGHPVNQQMYVARLLDWAVSAVSNRGPQGIVYFEAFDEPWKGGDDKWGLFNVNRQARCSAQMLNTAATWAKESGSCADSAALYYVPPVVGAAVSTPTLPIFNETVTGWPPGMRADAYQAGTFVLGYPMLADSAPGDMGASLASSHYLQLSAFTPADYGWGLLWQSDATPALTANLSAFESGAVRFSIKTTYAGKLRVGISSDTMTGGGAEAQVLLANGDYGYCNTGMWCDVTIPLRVFKAANPKLDLRLVLTRFSISDVWSATGNTTKTGMPAIKLDSIYWQR